MRHDTKHRLNFSDIGYKGKPLDSLTREELMQAFLELPQQVYECASSDNRCKDIFRVKPKG